MVVDGILLKYENPAPMARTRGNSSEKFPLLGDQFDWVREAMNRDKTKSVGGLAAAIGLKHSGASDILHGKRRLSLDKIPKAEEYLGVRWLSHRTGAVNATALVGASPAAIGRRLDLLHKLFGSDLVTFCQVNKAEWKSYISGASVPSDQTVGRISMYTGITQTYVLTGSPVITSEVLLSLGSSK